MKVLAPFTDASAPIVIQVCEMHLLQSWEILQDPSQGGGVDLVGQRSPFSTQVSRARSARQEGTLRPYQIDSRVFLTYGISALSKDSDSVHYQN